jgi:outer membrane protein assembly factor BamB
MKKFIAFLFCLYFSVSFAQDFSEWRGSNRSGVYNETGLLTEWPKNGPELLWSLENLPKGYSSVAVANKMIYFTGIKEQMDVVLAYDIYGNKLWERAYGRAWDGSYDHSRCTPTIEGDKMYLSSGLGDLACLNALDGSIVWQVKATEKYEGSFGKWGISESLIVSENKVFYTPGGNKTTMIALEKSSGKLIWKSKSLEDNPAYVSPIIYEHNGKKQIAQVTEKYAFGIDPLSGDILWTFDFGSYSNKQGWNIQCNSPVYHEGYLYVTAGYDHKGVMLKIAENGKSVELVWSDENLDVHHGGVVKLGDYLYGANWKGNRMGNWICLDWKTGKLMYETEWINKGSIISAEGMLYCYEEKTGNIALVKANPNEFKVISSFKAPLGTGPHWSHLVIYNGRLYVRHEDALMVYDIKKK